MKTITSSHFADTTTRVRAAILYARGFNVRVKVSGVTQRQLAALVRGSLASVEARYTGHSGLHCTQDDGRTFMLLAER